MNHKLKASSKTKLLPNKGQRPAKTESDRKKTVKTITTSHGKSHVKRKFAFKKPEIPVNEKHVKSDGDLKSYYYVSSTPLNTPIKVEKLKCGGSVESNVETLSDISKTSSSSACSSVSSGLIELLCNYNAEVLKKDAAGAAVSRGAGYVDLDATPKAETTYSFVIPTEAPNCSGRLQLILELMKRLRGTVNSILSSGDSRSMKRMEKIVEGMEKELSVLQKDLPEMLRENRDMEAEIEAATGPLKTENAALQRKLRIVNQKLAETERKQSENDINLELQTVQCMNNTLMEQVQKLSSTVQQLQQGKKTHESLIAKLKSDNVNLSNDIANKNVEFTKSQEIFSTEAGTIKTEVASALKKVDALKRELCEAETEGELMKINIQERDEEIARLNDLNKGLQSSVARLLEDLKKASQPPSNLRPSGEVSTAFLKKLQTLLNHPPTRAVPSKLVPTPKRNELIPLRCPGSPPTTHTDDYFGFYGSGTEHYQDNFLPNHENVLESSRLSSAQTENGFSEQLSIIEAGFKNAQRMEQFPGSSIAGMGNGNLRSWDPSSVSSSFISFTSRDENDFANGLAVLDADIQRLQHSLHDMTAANT